MFEYTKEAWLSRIQHLRLHGNKANNSSGSCIYNEKTHEMKVVDCEIRSFIDHGIHFNPDVSMAGYDTIRECWILANDGREICLDTQTGGSIDRVNIFNNIINPSSGGGVTVEDGATVKRVFAVGNDLWNIGGSGILLNSGVKHFIANNFFNEITSGGIGINFNPGSAHDFNAYIQGNKFSTEGSGVGSGIEMNTNTDYVFIAPSNKFDMDLKNQVVEPSGANTNGTSPSKRVLKDNEGNTFAKLEDTAYGGKITIYNDAEEKMVYLYSSGTNTVALEVESGKNLNVKRTGEGTKWQFSANNLNFETLKMQGNVIEGQAEGTGASDPTTDAPDGWVKIITQAGNTRYIPFYT